ncbi:hypothetical protein LG634_35745 [Streptomyces bambusae]|uniref:hypothetical protein n=1 Tax=Streptomyces bambusae TaxID=1550616 RepID=UPI001CFF692F|nr:hypothetical protein [Streptomyces bambusae]MCB5170141.1 hypothetical protein [Streptomyces bambusae]
MKAKLEADAEAAGEAARLRQAIRWSRMLEAAYTEHDQRSQTAEQQAAAQRLAAAEAKQVHLLREQLVSQHPELAAYAHKQQ